MIMLLNEAAKTLMLLALIIIAFVAIAAAILQSLGLFSWELL